ncbi:hypothetical protein QJQ45_017565 [Haematococcus lacustris]|nr:hypothetical protein QJQ45_017565 [Haematococcus lacustris]
MGLWGFIIAHTSGRPARQLAFGAAVTVALTYAGMAFSEAMYPTPTAEQVKARLERLSFDDRMMEEGRAQILSTMITDVAEGRGDPHWQAAMRPQAPMRFGSDAGVDLFSLSRMPDFWHVAGPGRLCSQGFCGAAPRHVQQDAADRQRGPGQAAGSQAGGEGGAGEGPENVVEVGLERECHAPILLTLQQRDQPVRGMMWCPVVAPRKAPQSPRSSQAATQAAASEPGPSTPPPAKRSKCIKAEPAAEPNKAQGKAAKAKPAPQPGRWLDRDCNAALNMQRIGESRWRPLELCWWPDQGALPAKGKEYPGLGYKRERLLLGTQVIDEHGKVPEMRTRSYRPSRCSSRSQYFPACTPAYNILGVSATATFDEVLSLYTVCQPSSVVTVPAAHDCVQVVNAKNKLMSGTRDQQRRMELESAYDVIFMQNMKKRLSGELEVSTSVRYADVPAAVQKKSFRSGTANKAASSAGSGPRSSTLAKLPATAGQWPVVSVPQDTKTLATTAAVFTGLATWALVQASLESPEAQIQDTAGFQLALAFAASLYFMKEKKRVPLGRAFGLSFASLIVGQLAGSLVEQWLRVDIVPIGPLAMGICQSVEAVRGLERALLDAVIAAKSKSASQRKASFNGLLMQFPKLRPGFQKVHAQFTSIAKPGAKSLLVEELQAHRHELGFSDSLDLTALLKRSGVTSVSHDELVAVYTIVSCRCPDHLLPTLSPDIMKTLKTIVGSWLTAALPAHTQQPTPAARWALGMLTLTLLPDSPQEAAFTYFDSSSDGFLEKTELMAVLKSGTKVFGTKTGRRQTRTVGEILFDYLDGDGSGKVSFLEFLEGIQKLVMSEQEEWEEDEAMQEFAESTRLPSKTPSVAS